MKSLVARMGHTSMIHTRSKGDTYDEANNKKNNLSCNSGSSYDS